MQDGDIQIISTDHLTAPAAGNDLFASRKNIYDRLLDGMPEATVCVLAYNRLEKTRRCVEAILRYTQGIDYELLLIDNGSEDQTLAYFKGVEHPRKKIARVTKNLGAQYATNLAMRSFAGRHFVLVTNDAVVTKNWLANLLRCLASDPKIGMVTPGSSNVSNLQEIGMEFSTYEEMQNKAALYNQSSPAKWEQRIRLVAIIIAIKREVVDLIGIDDPGFFHDFEEDDLSVRVRRAGYKLMVCMDTFIHHDHDFRHGEDKDQGQFQASLEAGRKNFMEKYNGLDSWSDMSNYEPYLPALFPAKKPGGVPSILGVDVMCGMPVLQIKNELRRRNLLAASCSAFTTQARYLCDLQTVCDDVGCDRIDGLSDFLGGRTFDYIVLGREVNAYPDLPGLLRRLTGALRPAGSLFLKLRNCRDVSTYLALFGHQTPEEEGLAAVSLEQFNGLLRPLGVQSRGTVRLTHQVDPNTEKVILRSLENSGLTGDAQSVYTNLMTRYYAFRVTR